MESEDQGGRRLEPPGRADEVGEVPGWRLIGPPEAAGPPAAELDPAALAAPSSAPPLASLPTSPAPPSRTPDEPRIPPAPPLPRLAVPARGPRVGLPWAIALVASLLALAGAAISTALQREVRALESASQRTPDASDLARSADEQARRAQLLARDLADLERVQAELTRNLGQERERVRALEADLAAEDERRAAARRELERGVEASAAAERELTRELEAERGAAARREAALQAERARNEGLRAEVESLHRTSGAEGRCANGFDRVLSRVEAGSGAAACALLEQLEGQRIFAPAAGDGSRFLAALTRAASALEESRGQRSTNGATGVRALLAARARLDEALSQRAAFAREAQEWLAVEGSTEERLARVDRALAELQTRLGSALSDIEMLHRQDWARILERGVRQTPELALQHEETFGCAHGADLAAGYSSALRSQCERDGRLELETLGQQGELPHWGRRALELQPAARSSADLDLLWLWYAQRWYLAGPEDDAPFDWSGLGMPPVAGPSADWRAVLRLEIELLAPGSGWPPSPGEASVYRLEGDSRARWRVDRCEPSGGGRESALSWRLVRTHFDAGGVPLGASSVVQIERAGRRFRYTGSDAILVDLGQSGEGVQARPFPELPREVPPSGTGINAGQARASSERAAAASGPCLVQTHGPWTRWFRPGLGLVLESRSTPLGEVRIELAAVWSP